MSSRTGIVAALAAFLASSAAWAAGRFRPAGFVYPVVTENVASRRLAESLGGTLVGTAVLRKPSGVTLDEVVYRIPAVDARAGEVAVERT